MGRGRGRARVGCSGWQYKHWRGDFYPASLPQSRWFEHDAATFDTVEINNSFYRLPERATFASWGRKYGGAYPEPRLRGWAEWLKCCAG